MNVSFQEPKEWTGCCFVDAGAQELGESVTRQKDGKGLKS